MRLSSIIIFNNIKKYLCIEVSSMRFSAMHVVHKLILFIYKWKEYLLKLFIIGQNMRLSSIIIINNK